MDPQRTTRTRITWRWSVELLRNVHLNTDRIFYRIGLDIGTRPWLWLLASLCISGVCGSGMLLWREELDDVELFIPLDSVIRSDAAWVKENFRNDMLYESIIVTAPNVLDPKVLRAISEIEEAVKGVVANNQTWHDVCAGYLTWFENNGAETFHEEDIPFPKEILTNGLAKDGGCIYQSLLTIWQTDKSKRIQDLDEEEALKDVSLALNDQTNKKMLFDVAPLLSDVEYDESTGQIRGAKATILHWILKKSNPHSLDWELGFIDSVLNSNRSTPDGMEIYAVASRSFADFIHEILNNNMIVLFCGLSLIAIYVIIMLGRCNLVQQRVYLSLMGVSVVGQAILSAYGVCYYIGYFYGPIHPILPFLLLGIGVDDMFVVMQSLDNLPEADKALEVPQRMAKALQQSGVSITVTSITNVAAFAIGVTTVMPFLESFCVFATMGILFLYVFEITFFVSCLAFDERRLEMRREGCCCSPAKAEWKPNACSQRNIQQTIFENFVGPLISRRPVKVVVLLLTAVVLAANVWGIFQLEQNFDPLWYLDQDSYPIKFNDKLKEYFPKYGKRAAVYLAGVNYYEDREALAELMDALRSNRYVNSGTVDSWFVAFDEWLDFTGYAVDHEDEYYGYLSEYLLLTKKGRAYINDMKFDRPPISDYNVTISLIQIQHILIDTTSDQVRAMQSIRESIEAVNFTRGYDHIAVFSPDYVSWTANKIIGEELIRNLGLEILAVGMVTILLLRNPRASFWVICCVLFTLVDLLGSMYYLGLTVEISSSIMVLLCAGLAVDYAAHVGLEFTRATGTRNERMIATLGVIGPAVFNGGLSTFLAFVLLGASEAYLFSTFFKLFTSVVVFGLYHGLIFLPVILSLFGPCETRRESGAKLRAPPEQSRYFVARVTSNGKEPAADRDLRAPAKTV